MSELPKLRVRSLLSGEASAETEVNDLEQVRRHFDADGETIVVVEGQLINSYDELVKLIARGEFKGKEMIEVTLLPLIEGG